MIQIIEVSSSLGAPNINSGMELGPPVLSDVLMDIGQFVPGIIKVTIPNSNPEHARNEYSNSKYLPEILVLNNEIREQVKQTVSQRNFPLILMGDDSSTIGAVYGLLEFNPEMGIIWFDAHGDINVPETSPSGCFYGMGLAHILGFGHPHILELNKTGNFIGTAKVGMIGQRNLDTHEIELISKHNIQLISVASIRQNSEEQINKLINQFRSNGVKSLFIHFDLDVLDPSENPPVFAPNVNGLFISEVSAISMKLKASFKLTGISIANYIPNNDIDDFKNRIKAIVN